MCIRDRCEVTEGDDNSWHATCTGLASDTQYAFSASFAATDDNGAETSSDLSDAVYQRTAGRLLGMIPDPTFADVSRNGKTVTFALEASLSRDDLAEGLDAGACTANTLGISVCHPSAFRLYVSVDGAPWREWTSCARAAHSIDGVIECSGFIPGHSYAVAVQAAYTDTNGKSIWGAPSAVTKITDQEIVGEPRASAMRQALINEIASAAQRDEYVADANARRALSVQNVNQFRSAFASSSSIMGARPPLPAGTQDDLTDAEIIGNAPARTQSGTEFTISRIGGVPTASSAGTGLLFDVTQRATDTITPRASWEQATKQILKSSSLRVRRLNRDGSPGPWSAPLPVEQTVQLTKYGLNSLWQEHWSRAVGMRLFRECSAIVGALATAYFAPTLNQPGPIDFDSLFDLMVAVTELVLLTHVVNTADGWPVPDPTVKPAAIVRT